MSAWHGLAEALAAVERVPTKGELGTIRRDVVETNVDVHESGMGKVDGPPIGDALALEHFQMVELGALEGIRPVDEGEEGILTTHEVILDVEVNLCELKVARMGACM